ncbi:MAG: hypothetical protein LBV12_06455 [Puniceicoccales bacterium]|nr:hypothetical protein [Puniceicoccales bacterium]
MKNLSRLFLLVLVVTALVLAPAVVAGSFLTGCATPSNERRPLSPMEYSQTGNPLIRNQPDAGRVHRT